MKKRGIGEKPHLKKKTPGLVRIRPGRPGCFTGRFFNKLGPIQPPSPGLTRRAGPDLITLGNTRNTHQHQWQNNFIFLFVFYCVLYPLSLSNTTQFLFFVVFFLVFFNAKSRVSFFYIMYHECSLA
jgi:hypothetical protein